MSINPDELTPEMRRELMAECPMSEDERAAEIARLSRALEQAEQAVSAQAERAAIVAWLRELAALPVEGPTINQAAVQASARLFADRISRGDHLKDRPS